MCENKRYPDEIQLLSPPVPKQNPPRTPQSPPAHESSLTPKDQCMFLGEIKRHLVRNMNPVFNIISLA